MRQACVIFAVAITITAAARADAPKHWAYIKPARPDVPNVAGATFVRNPIDAFVLARLRQDGLDPSAMADRETLIRRVSLDLAGLPPTIAEVDAFLRDISADAYERVVDRLLASPRYGERWAQTWLDAARYADSNGYTNDRPRTVWPYRDWVIKALNDDLPFDRFTILQIAGDMLPNATEADRIATAFHRNAMWNDEMGVDVEELRYVTLVERVGVTATVWLGSTLQCAQCHTHKYDPFTQKEFFRLLAFFETGDYQFKGETYNRQFIEPTLDAASPEKQKERGQLEQELKELRKRINLARQKLAPKQVEQMPEQARVKEVIRELTRLNATYPITPVMCERKGAAYPPETVLRIKGGFLSKGQTLTAGVPEVLHPLPAGEPVNRLTLAKWLVSPENPLVARVTVNRAWAQFFGRGIVETEEDFGRQSGPPSHPELLDWLAMEFVANGWSFKRLHKTIAMSATYRQDSRVTPASLERDPYNRLLARGPRVRLSAEAVRDTMLAVSGLLSAKSGGPSVFPPMPEVTAIGDHGDVEWPESTGEDRYRRGLYTFWRRSALHPSLLNFDAPTREACTVRRPRTNTPLQALTLLNDTTAAEAAAALAKRLPRDAGEGLDIRVEHAFRLCTSRLPTPAEREAVRASYEKALKLMRGDAESSARVCKSAGIEPPDADFAAWFLVAQSLLNLDEVFTKG